MQSFVEVMKKWTNQKGYPLVKITQHSNNTLHQLVVEQSWYHQDQEEGDQLWDIPITITQITSSGTFWNKTSPDFWLTQKSMIVDFDLQEDTIALVANSNAVGYYRVDYGYEGWYNLGLILAADHTMVHPHNRAQIICDVLSLVETGYLGLELSEHVLAFLSVEKDLAPLMAWEACSNPLTTINTKNVNH